MLVLGIVTTLLLCGVFSLQAFVIDTFLIIELGLACYVFVGLDGLLIIYILCSVSMEFAALRGGIIWLLYSWVLLPKLALLYWCVFVDSSHFIKDAVVFKYFHVDQSLFLTPVIFAIVSFRASCVLYGSSPLAVTLESMLHVDMVVHVILDLIDLMLSLHLLNYEELMYLKYRWIRLFSGIFVLAGIFMHSYSFPTTLAVQMDIPPKLTNAAFQQPSESMCSSYYMNPSHLPSQADIFLTRKHAALVSLFFVDLPLVISRITLWTVFPRIFTDHAMLSKNILFIPLQIFRLNQCRLAEKDRAKKLKRQDSIKPNSYWIQGTNRLLRLDKESSTNAVNEKKSHMHDTSLRQRKFKDSPRCLSHEEEHSNSYRSPHRHNISFSSDTLSDKISEEDRMQIVTSYDSSSYYSNVVKNSHQLTKKNTALGLDPTLNSWKCEPNLTMNATHVPLETQSNSDVDVKKTNSMVTPSEIYQLVRDINTKRTIPVRGFSFCIILRKILKCIKMGGRRGMLPLLDDTLLLSYWKQIRLTFPLLIAWTTQIILVSIVVLNNENSPPQQINFPWIEISREYCLFLYVIGVSSILMFLTWLMYAPFVDLMFFLVLWIIRSTCFASTLVVLRDTQFFDVSSLWNSSTKRQPIILLLLYIPPLLRLLYSLFPIQSALLGRQYISVWPKNNDQSSITTLHSSLNENRPHDDQKDNITTSSLLVFLNCRYALAPASLCQLLIGPNIVKDVRIIDMLLMRSWLETFFLLTLHICMITRYQSKFFLSLFLIYFVLCGVYNIITQVIRLLCLRRYEIKLTFEQILRKMQENPITPMYHSSNSGVSPKFDSFYNNDYHHVSTFQSCVLPTNSNLLPPRGFLLSLIAVLDIYQREGYFTSPGQIFLNYF